ncbi:zinc ribbon domain-containing protein [Halieaceae bacterium IMCC14734]|uniref:Zinc ribbon domain-containing protein n=1 Tax=Candidatus Litorirhabdus singularis TaxID=2518993 RepID=A0ABT3TD16_9GAMM|nr:zinc ribbon domain-containing protein [Candidatus Litorirhabdus singularis]MCX2979334.1 zinc ribbon domain-containing protein [Candidatus Litorirhabdus singularis]
MPIYEYQCQSCQHSLEALQKISDDPLLECPACGAAALNKKVSAAAFRLKGGGWYETDFKTGNKKNLAGDSGGDSAGGSAPAAGKKADSGSSSGGKSGDSKAAG